MSTPTNLIRPSRMVARVVEESVDWISEALLVTAVLAAVIAGAIALNGAGL